MSTKKHRLMVWGFIILAVIYAAVVLLTPPDSRAISKYHLSTSSVKIISLSFIVPYVAIWFTALFGYLKFKTYAETIKKAKDGTAMSKVADGLLLLALYMPISAIVNSAGLMISRSHPNFLPSATIISNYANLALALAAFYIIYRGSECFLPLLKKYNGKLPDENVMVWLFVVFSTIYAYFTLNNPARQFPTATTARAAYYLPDWLLFISIVIPSIVMWYLGFKAVLYIRAYSKNIPGATYRHALGYLSSGILVTLLSIISLRLLTSMTAWFDNQALKVILLILYLLLILIASGYVLIAKGAKKLQRIEEV